MDKVSVYRTHIENCIRNADKYSSKCPRTILAMSGMSGKKTRHFYNNICSLPDTRYLEIGTWKGSSFFSAIHGNNIHATAIDNWSYSTENIREEFFRNLSHYTGVNVVSVIENDCWNVTLDKTFNIYLYDGDHTMESHARALAHFINNMDDVFIYMVDDWNDLRVREGTIKGISDANIHVKYQREIYTTDDNSHPVVHGEHSDWHNGLCIFVLTKHHM